MPKLSDDWLLLGSGSPTLFEEGPGHKTATAQVLDTCWKVNLVDPLQ